MTIHSVHDFSELLSDVMKWSYESRSSNFTNLREKRSATRNLKFRGVVTCETLSSVSPRAIQTRLKPENWEFYGIFGFTSSGQNLQICLNLLELLWLTPPLEGLIQAGMNIYYIGVDISFCTFHHWSAWDNLRVLLGRIFVSSVPRATTSGSRASGRGRNLWRWLGRSSH